MSGPAARSRRGFFRRSNRRGRPSCSIVASSASGCPTTPQPTRSPSSAASPALGTRPADPNAHTEPLSWSDSLKYGHYLLDDRSRLLPAIEEIFRMAHDHNAAIFFGHPTKQEFRALAEFSHKIGFKKGVVDHPFSPFVNLTIEEMKEAAAAGLWLNFTYDELSPLLGIDPANMYKAIRAIGPEHCTLSSDAGEPLFPNSVESLRLLRGHMAAFGGTPEQIYTMCTVNPSFIVGLNLTTTQRASTA